MISTCGRKIIVKNKKNSIRAFLQQIKTMTSGNDTSLAARRVSCQQQSVWNEFAVLARDCEAVNIGQGFPDTEPPHFIVDAMKKALDSPDFMMHQYARGFGHPRLVNILAKFYSQLLDHDINAFDEITITVGGYNALFSAIFAFINPGDEAIIIEPYFDCYSSQVEMADGVPIFVPLRPTKNKSAVTSADYKLDFAEFESKFTKKTKLLILNNPNNPLGKVFDRDELQKIADIVQKYNVVVISDEVYEWMVYPGNEMVRFASLPGMWDKTITIGSAGKVFSITGWKIGWCIAPSKLMNPIRALHQNCTYTCATILQEAVAAAFEQELALLGTDRSYFKLLVDDLLAKRDKMHRFLTDVGMKPILPQGSYFMLTDYSSIPVSFDSTANNGDSKDFRFARWLCKEKKLAGIPPSAFYSKPHKYMGENLVRFCFCKKESTLDAAEQIVRQWKSSIP